MSMWKRLKKLARRFVEPMAMRALQTVGQWEEGTLPQFAIRPRNLTMRLPRASCFPEQISIGDDVWFWPGSLPASVIGFAVRALWPESRPHNCTQIFEPGL
jgi:hypothetical protein